MRFFLNPSTFISVIPSEGKFSCQVMELVFGSGMYPATIMDNQQDVVSCVVYESDVITETSRICKDLNEVALFHQQCFIQLELAFC